MRTIGTRTTFIAPSAHFTKYTTAFFWIKIKTEQAGSLTPLRPELAEVACDKRSRASSRDAFDLRQMPKPGTSGVFEDSRDTQLCNEVQHFYNSLSNRVPILQRFDILVAEL